MEVELLQQKVAIIKSFFERTILEAGFNGKTYANGQEAKAALIKSQRLINEIHEVVKVDINTELQRQARRYTIHPPIGKSSPELPISGFIKSKKQDVVTLFNGDTPQRERIEEGVLAGNTDKVGKRTTERSIIIGVRSQLSSVDKNFDTLMERAFAETLNLRLRMPHVVMGEVYLLPVYEYDDDAMKQNQAVLKSRPVSVERFINTFNGISGRESDNNTDLYKYERSVLLLFDPSQNPPKVFTTLDELKEGGFVPQNSQADYSKLTPLNFGRDIIAARDARHS